jgi:hypothetical protein
MDRWTSPNGTSLRPQRVTAIGDWVLTGGFSGVPEDFPLGEARMTPRTLVF